jgi:hypothetical protein
VRRAEKHLVRDIALGVANVGCGNTRIGMQRSNLRISKRVCVCKGARVHVTNFVDEWQQQVRFIICGRALQHRAHAFQTHA